MCTFFPINDHGGISAVMMLCNSHGFRVQRKPACNPLDGIAKSLLMLRVAFNFITISEKDNPEQ